MPRAEMGGARGRFAGTFVAHRAGRLFWPCSQFTMNPQNERALQGIRHQVRDVKKVARASALARFPDSTDKPKGGPIVRVPPDTRTCRRLPVGTEVNFWRGQGGQARAISRCWRNAGRRALRVHLGKNVKGDLAKLAKPCSKR